MKEEKWFSAPKWIEALLISLDSEIERLYWNKYQKEWDSPLTNNGEGFYKNDRFMLKCYDWDNEYSQYNFQFGDFKIRWYKHVKRCLEMNREIDECEFIFMYNECLESIYNDFGEEYK